MRPPRFGLLVKQGKAFLDSEQVTFDLLRVPVALPLSIHIMRIERCWIQYSQGNLR